MKNLVQDCLQKFGFRIISLKNEKERLTQQVKQIEGVYRDVMWKDFPAFEQKRIDLMARLMGTSSSEGMYISYFLNRSLKFAGDVCEFGVAQGRTSALLAFEIAKTTKSLWLFDSFEGLPKPTEHDQLKDDIFKLGSMEKYAGTMSCRQDMVKAELENLSFPRERTKIIPGFIEQTINGPLLPQQVCFAYVDFDFYEPIRVALEYLDQVLVQGGFIIVDDYDFFSTGAKKAVDEFVDRHKNKYRFEIPLPSAGHFCILEKIK